MKTQRAITPIMLVAIAILFSSSKCYDVPKEKNDVAEAPQQVEEIQTPELNTTDMTQTENPTIEEPKQEDIRNKTSDKDDSPLILGLFNAGMTPKEYKDTKQHLIATGKLNLWDETNYYVDLFSVQETVYNTSVGQYSAQNTFTVELRYEPVFQNGRFVSWELPVWPLLPDNAPNDRRSTNNLQLVIDYFTNSYGTSSQNGSTYIWAKGNLKIEVSMKGVDPDLTDGFNDRERIPVITYRAV